MRKFFFLIVSLAFGIQSGAQTKIQSNYEITLQVKHYKDTVAYLTYFQFGNKITRDTSHNIRNGLITFKGKGKLERGIYALTDSKKKNYFDFFIDENTQKLQLKTDVPENHMSDITALNSKLENDFFEYVRYLIGQNKAIQEAISKGKGLPKKDSIAVVQPLVRSKIRETYNTEEAFIAQNKGTYIADVINLKIDRTLYDAPNASNGRPDSLLIKKYFRRHFWDQVDFNANGIYRNQFFAAKINNYLDNVVAPHADSIAVAIDKLLLRTKSNPKLTRLLMDHLVAKYESIPMGFDKVLIYLADTYFRSGKARNLYADQEDFNRVLRRADKIRPLQVGQTAPDLFMIDVADRDKVARLGFESVKTNDELNRVFTANQKAVNDLFFRMNSVKADYLIVVFWDVDCSHCKIEIPKLLDLYHDFRNENKDVKVYSVYVRNDIAKYQQYIAEKKLDWINVYDGVYYNNVIDKYQVVTTPVIYILDKNKVIRAKKVPVERIRETIENLQKQ